MSAYYSIIPANVRYCKNLNANAKLLYGEITALLNDKGFCFASDQYFADLYDVSLRTVERWVKDLCDNGFIYINSVKTKRGTQRQIYIKEAIAKPDKNVANPPDKNVANPPDKNDTCLYKVDNINLCTNKKENIKRKKDEMENEIFKVVDPDMWREWQQYRKEIKKPLTQTTIKRQIAFLHERYTEHGENPNDIIKQSIFRGWQGLFEIQKLNYPTLQAQKKSKNSNIDRFFENLEQLEQNKIIAAELIA